MLSKQNFPKILCAFVSKNNQYIMLFNCQFVKLFLPHEWSSDGHGHLSSQTFLLENNLSVLFFFFGLSPDPIGHLL